MSLGLRWEVNPSPGVTQGIKPFTVQFQGTGPDTWALAPQGTALWRTTWFNFAPRLGGAYLIRDTQGWETVVRAGGGLFFDSAQQLGSESFIGPGFAADGGFATSPFPGNPVVPQIVEPPSPPFFGVYGFAPHLQLPYTIQWNASVEQELGKSQALSVSYVGSHAGRLLQQNQFKSSANPILAPGFGEFIVIQNGLTSDFDSLQIQFHRKLARGLTALASYTWSHCLDYGSTNFLNGYDRGNCGFDVRHNFSAAFSYDLPNFGRNGIANAILHHWGLDNRFAARTAFPVDLIGTEVFDPATDRRLSNGLNFTGQPIYIYGSQCDAVYVKDFGATLPCPGGRAINPDAFVAVASGSGKVPRNFARGFGAWQMNVAVRREFPIHEGLKLQFRFEAFNAFNHPNFGFIKPNWGQSTFGQATSTLANSLGALSPLYQMGGPRSMQFSLKLAF